MQMFTMSTLRLNNRNQALFLQVLQVLFLQVPSQKLQALQVRLQVRNLAQYRHLFQVLSQRLQALQVQLQARNLAQYRQLFQVQCQRLQALQVQLQVLNLVQ